MAVVTSLNERVETSEKALIAYQSTELKGMGDEEMMRKKVGQLQTTVDLMRSERDLWQTRFTDMEKESKSRISELIVGNERLEAQVQTMHTQQTKHESHQGDSSRLIASIKALETKNLELKRERDEFFTSLNAACDRITELEEQNASIQTELDLGRNSNVDSLRSQLVTMESNEMESKKIESQLKETIHELTIRLKKSKDEISMLQQELSMPSSSSSSLPAEQMMQQLTEQLEQKDRDMVALTNERDELVAEVEKALQQVSELTEALIESDNINTAATAAVTAATMSHTTDVNEANAAKINQLTSLVENLQENVNEADKQIEAMAVQMQQLEDECGQLRATNEEQQR